MKPTVLIIGDSWAGGEWDGGDQPNLLHRGLEQYFEEADYKVINQKKSGRGNQDSAIDLSNTLKRLPRILIQTNLVIFFIVSEPLRNYAIPFETLKDDIVAHDGLFELQQQVLRQDFKILNQLAANHNIMINLIGGLSSVPAFVSEFANLNCLVRSWAELLVGHDPQFNWVDWDTFGIWGKWQATLVQQLSHTSEIDRKVIDQLSVLASNQSVFLHPLFNPDGGHPNRTGHRILFDFICEKLEL